MPYLQHIYTKKKPKNIYYVSEIQMCGHLYFIWQPYVIPQ